MYNCILWNSETKYFGGCLQNVIFPFVIFLITFFLTVFSIFYSSQNALRRYYIRTSKKVLGFTLSQLLLLLLMASYILTDIITSSKLNETFLSAVFYGLTGLFQFLNYYWAVKKGILNYKILIATSAFNFVISLNPLHDSIKLLVEDKTLSLWNIFTFFLVALSFTGFGFSFFTNPYRTFDQMHTDQLLPENNSTSEELAPELKSSLFSLLTFSWISPLIKTGFKRSLNFSDLTPLHPDEGSSVLYEKFKKAWDYEMNNHPPGKRSIARVFAKLYLKSFLTGSLLKAVYDILLFSGPIFLKKIVTFLEDSSNTDSQTEEYMGFIYTGILLVAYVSQTIFLHQYFHLMMRLGMSIRSSLVSMIYDTSLKIPGGMAGKMKPDGTINDSEAKSTGEIVNLMSVDTQRVQDLMTYVQIIWSGPLQIIIAMALLYSNVGVSAFGGLATSILMIPLSGYISRAIKAIQNIVMKERDKRLKITNETLSGIRVLKMLAWENSFANKIIEQRHTELGFLWKYQLTTALSRMQWNLAPILILFMCFTIYILMGNTLTAPIAFSTLALVNILRFPMQVVPNMINNVVEALVSLRRIQEFLEIPPLDPLKINLDTPPQTPIIQIQNADFSWFNKNSLLKNINLDVNKGELIAIVGSTGSGKSGLLYSIIGDTKKTGGSVSINGTLSYCAQVPWVQNCSVKDNIIFKKYYHDYYYKKVINACALKPDFDVLPAGDETEIGERGINLSGGQKQRITMARSLYHPADIYLFDDCFSALDANVAKHVFRKAFLEILKDQTVLLVTHKLDLLPFCDRILFIQDKTIIYNGPFSGLQNMSFYQEFSTSQMITDADTSTDHSTPSEIETLSQTSTPNDQMTHGSDFEEAEDDKFTQEKLNLTDEFVLHKKSPATLDMNQILSTKKHKDVSTLITTEQIFHGKVSKYVYWQYIKNASLFVVSLYLFCQTLSNLAQMGSSFWLSFWSGNPDFSSAAGLSMYAILALTQVFLTIFALIYMSISNQNAAEKFHTGLVDGIMNAPLSFFDTTPLGRIINRFAKDINVIDEELPANLSSYVMTILNIGVTVISISIAVPLFLIPMVILSGVYYYFQLYYIPTSRQLQRLDSVMRSPLFANFSETLDGAQTVRAFKYETPFLHNNQYLIDSNLRAYYLRVASNRWLAVRLECVGTGIIASTALLCVISIGKISPSVAGLAISYSLTITQSLTNLVRVAGTLESSIVSVERVNEYTYDITQEPNQQIMLKHTHNWPTQGAIKFVNFSLRYRPELPLVLKNLNFEIEPGSRIGIVGRTGAGKSSLMAALLRLNEPSSGYIEIDNVNTLSVNLKLLRSKFCLIPQSPTLFSGTLRFNVDPLLQCSDEQIMEALEKAHIKNFIISLSDDPLSFIVDESGKNFSVGQRQMICLARAIISNAKIVMFDEATSVVDPQTDYLIQRTIQSEFSNSTILTIAHRINTILNSNKILVLDNGEISEYDTPKALFSQKESIFRAMCLQSGVNVVNGEFTFDASHEVVVG